MSIDRPYRRTYRQLLDGSYSASGHGRYVKHPSYARDPEHYCRAFLLIQKDLRDLFDYVEPADQNLACYSYRIHELLLRACVEIEANLKAILLENGYARPGEWKMKDYAKIEKSHRLSEYEVRLPVWTGSKSTRRPFEAWGRQEPLKWHLAYNAAKHDRHAAFQTATFEIMLDAICGCLAVLTAQFGEEDFSGGADVLVVEGFNDGFSSAIGGLFRVKYPQSWGLDERYDFNWNTLQKEPDPFRTFSYPR